MEWNDSILRSMMISAKRSIASQHPRLFPSRDVLSRRVKTSHCFGTESTAIRTTLELLNTHRLVQANKFTSQTVTLIRQSPLHRRPGCLSA